MSDSTQRTSPYQGLTPFTEADAPFFFGREAEREIIISNLMASRLTLLYGTSGVGKSSLLQAGVVRDLHEMARQNQAIYGRPDIVVVYFNNWRDAPLTSLLTAIQGTLARSMEGTGERPPPPAGKDMVRSLQAWSEWLNGDLVILLDQFEEYSLYHSHEEGEGTFAREFPRAVNRNGLRVNFLVSLREDAVAKLDRFKGHIPALFGNYLRVQHLEREGAYDAIRKPLEYYNALHKSNILIEDALVEAVLDQVRAGQVQLGESGRGTVQQVGSHALIETPYLQMIMTRLWNEERAAGSELLRLSTLEELKGAEQILRSHLDTVLSDLSESEQGLLAEMFHHLVTPSGTKIAHTATDLANYAELPKNQVRALLEKLASGGLRILRPIAPPIERAGSEPRYEIFHDVLAAPILDWRRRVTEAREQERLLNEEAERVRLEEAERRREMLAEAEAERRRLAERHRLLRYITVGLVILLPILIGLMAMTWIQTVRAEQEQSLKKQTLSRQLAFQARHELATGDREERAILLALEAGRTAGTTEALDILHEMANELPAYLYYGYYGGGATHEARWSADERLILTAGDDGMIRLWDAVSGQQRFALQDDGAVYGARWSADESRILTAGGYGAARIWDATSGEALLTLQHQSGVQSAIWNADESLILTASDDGTARIWDAESGQERFSFQHQSYVFTAQWNKDESRILTASADGTARVWDIDSRQPRLTLRHRDWVRSVHWSADERLILTASDDGIARVWDAASGKPLLSLPHDDYVMEAQWNNDESHILTASHDGTARVWDATTGAELLSLPHEGELVIEASWNAAETHILTISSESGDIYGAGKVRIWDARSGIEQLSLPRVGGLVARWNSAGTQFLAFTSDGGQLWDAEAGQARLAFLARTDDQLHWNRAESRILLSGIPGEEYIPSIRDAATGLSLLTLSHEHPVRQALWDGAGNQILTLDREGTVRLWDAASGEERLTLPHEDPIAETLWDAAGSQLLTISRRGEVRLWDAASGEERHLLPHEAPVLEAQWDGAGNQILTLDREGEAHLWDAATGEKLRSLPYEGGILTAQWNAAGSQILTVSGEGTAHVWESASGQRLRTLQHQGWINRAFWNADGNQILTISGDKTAHVWDAEAGQPRYTLQHEGWVSEARWSGDGSRILTASEDGTARIWEAASGKELLSFPHPAGVTEAMWSRDERRIFTVSRDGAVRIFHTDLQALLNAACERAKRELTEEEWKEFVGTDTPYETRDSCPPYLEQIALGKSEASEGKIEAAVAAFREALRQEPSLDLVPEAEARRYGVPALFVQGQTQARGVRIPEAEETLREVLALNPSFLRFDPEQMAVELAADSLLEQGDGFAFSGEIDRARDAYEVAQALDPSLDIPASSWNTLCWYGSMWDQVVDVLDACEKAVAAEGLDALTLASHYFSRAIARSLQRNYWGASQDLKFVLEVQESMGSADESFKTQAEGWITELEARRNPFNEATLNNLRNQYYP